eukprot:gene14034-16543_t
MSNDTARLVGNALDEALHAQDDDTFQTEQFAYMVKLEQQLTLANKSLETQKGTIEQHEATTLSLQKELALQRSKFFDLERTNTLLKSEVSESRIKVDEAHKSSERKIALQNKELDELLSNIKYISKAESDLKKKYDDLLEKSTSDEKNYQLKIKALEKERTKYRSDANELKHKSNSSNDWLTGDKTKDLQIKSANDTIALLEAELQEIKVKLESTTMAMTDLQANQRPVDSTSSSTNARLQQSIYQLEQLNKSLQNDVGYYSELSKKNSLRIQELEIHLKSVGNAELLKAENTALKERVGRYEEHMSKYSKLQADHTALLEDQKTLQGVYGKIDQFSVAQFQQQIRELEAQNQVYLGRIGELTSSLKLTESRNSDSTSTMNESKESINTLNAKISSLEETISRLNKQVFMFKRERDGTKRILDAFDIEGKVENKDSETNNGSVRMERVNELERVMVEKDRLLEEYERKLANLSTNGSSSADDGIDYKHEVAKLNKDIDRLLQDNALLEARLGKGEYDVSKTKVLHMTNNPSNIPNSQDNVEKGSTQSETKLIEENNGLRVLVSEHEKKTERLKQVFKLKINEFREAVYALFGYKIDMDTNSTYRLQSMYAEHETDELVFQRVVQAQGKIGKMELMETDFTNTLDREVRAYLYKLHTIPAFLGQVTIDLFSRQTFHP